MVGWSDGGLLCLRCCGFLEGWVRVEKVSGLLEFRVGGMYVFDL